MIGIILERRGRELLLLGLVGLRLIRDGDLVVVGGGWMVFRVIVVCEIRLPHPPVFFEVVRFFRDYEQLFWCVGGNGYGVRSWFVRLLIPCLCSH